MIDFHRLGFFCCSGLFCVSFFFIVRHLFFMMYKIDLNSFFPVFFFIFSSIVYAFRHHPTQTHPLSLYLFVCVVLFCQLCPSSIHSPYIALVFCLCKHQQNAHAFEIFLPKIYEKCSIKAIDWYCLNDCATDCCETMTVILILKQQQQQLQKSNHHHSLY